jgi:hypothetical protein
MKKLIWFKEGDSIPSNSRFIRHDKRIDSEPTQVDEFFSSTATITGAVILGYNDFYLYEVDETQDITDEDKCFFSQKFPEMSKHDKQYWYDQTIIWFAIAEKWRDKYHKMRDPNL